MRRRLVIKIRFLYALDLLKVARLGTSYTCDKPSVTEGGRGGITRLD